MSVLNLNSTVGQWVAERPNTSRIFESYNIDYCCGGNVSLANACAVHGLDQQKVLERLVSLPEDAGDQSDRWLDASLAALCDHIVATHHAYLRVELPRLAQMIDKVLRVHGENHPELVAVNEAFADLQAELGPHMFKEEQILFPAIRRLEDAKAPLAFPFGTIANPIRMMEHEHDHAGNALERIRKATRDYQPPADACNTYRAMLDGLRELELNMHQHVHKENNILFPRAKKLEEASGVAEPLSLA